MSEVEENVRPVPISDPPDGGYGWVCVVAQFLINGFTWGVVAISPRIKCYGVYLSYFLSKNEFPDASTMDFAFIGGLQFSMAVIVAPLATASARMCGTKFPMLLGVGFLSGGFVAASFAEKVWHLYLSQGSMVGLGTGLLYLPSLPVISQWFEKKRSVANGICAAGSGIGGISMCFATDAMLHRIGFQWTLRISALVIFFMDSVATLLIRNRNDSVRPSQKVFDTKLARNRHVILLLLWSFISMFGYITLMFSLPEFGKSIGLSDSKAAAQAAFVNLGAALGRPLIGVCSDKFGRIEVAGVLTFFCGIICFAIWIPANSYGVLTFFSIFSGAILGVFWAGLKILQTIGPLGAEVGGLQELPSLLSLVWITIVLPTTYPVALGSTKPPRDLQPSQGGSLRCRIYPSEYLALRSLLSLGLGGMVEIIQSSVICMEQ
ncbi:MAG: hypothetical protein Q9163_003663 [Psora crenata]